MTLETAHRDLRGRVVEVWSAIAELMLIAVEDGPDPAGLAAAEDLAEQVSEVQGSLASATELLDEGPEALVRHIASVSRHLDEARTRYWRRLRSHASGDTVRRSAARRPGSGGAAWCRTVEDSSRRCEEPLDAVAEALHACWHEFSQLASTEDRKAGASRSTTSTLQRRTL